MRGNKSLDELLAVLREWGGYFVFSHDGEEFVVASKEEFEGMERTNNEMQLELPSSEVALADGDEDVLEKINRDIALFQKQFNDDEIMEEDNEGLLDGGANKVRFEPIKGDISPELQE